MKRILYVPIEVQRREFKAKLYLVCKALAEGHDVVIGRHWQVERFALRNYNGIYLSKSHFEDAYSKLEQMKQRNFQIIVHDEEGSTTGNTYDEYVNQRVGKRTLETCDNILAWGKLEESYLKRYVPQMSEKIQSAGNPRLDLLRSGSYGLYEKDVEKIHQKIGKYILVNTAFGHTEAATSKIREAYKNNKEATNDIYNYINACKATKTPFLDGIRYIADKLDIAIVLRPHPAEDIEEYKDLFKDYPNVYVTNSLGVNPWIWGASAVIYNSCTTGMESFIIGTPTIAFLPDGKSIFGDVWINKLGYMVTEREQLLTEINWILSKDIHADEIKNQYFSQEKWKELAEVILYDEQETSSSKFIRCFWNDEVSDGYNMMWKCGKFRIAEHLWRYLLDWYFYLRRDKYRDYKWISMCHKKLLEDVNEINRVLQLDLSIKVIPLLKDLYMLKAT